MHSHTSRHELVQNKCNHLFSFANIVSLFCFILICRDNNNKVTYVCVPRKSNFLRSILLVLVPFINGMERKFLLIPTVLGLFPTGLQFYRNKNLTNELKKEYSSPS